MIDLSALARKPCYGGLDLSKTRDTSAFVLVFPLVDLVHVLPFFFLPRGRAEEREKNDRVPYRLWASQGLIELTEGDVVDTRVIRRRIRALGEQYRIREIAYDPWNATDTAIELAENDGFEMIECRQGFATLSAPSKELENLVVSGRLRHGGHAVLRWHAGNISVKSDDNGNIRPVKPTHGDARKIDGIVATIMGIWRMMAHPKHTSVYETRGILQL